VNPPIAPLYTVEPLGDHDRVAFFCGIAELDHYLRHQAGQDAKRKVAVPFVMLDSSGAIAGYYTLSSYGIRPAELPPVVARKLPKYPLIPATLLGRLAIDRKRQGQKLGRLLLMDALHRSWKITAQVASIGVIVDAYDEAAQAFYRRHEFIPLPDHPNKFFISMRTIETAFLGDK
jgi:GNAT superfamily N-acetyltransferase